jgi:adenosylcobyric acid synthase
MGTYLHGAFTSDRFRSAFLRALGAATGDLAFDTLVDDTLDALASHLERHVDIDRLLALAGPVKP